MGYSERRIAEDLLAGTPVIASRGTPWEALNTRRCGWWCGNDSSSLAAALENAFSLSPQERLAMGERGRALVLESCAAPHAADCMKRLYRYLLGQEAKPEFVYLP